MAQKPLADSAMVTVSIEVKDGAGYGARSVSKVALEEQVVLEDAGAADRYAQVREKVRELATEAKERTFPQVNAHDALVKAERAKAEAEKV